MNTEQPTTNHPINTEAPLTDLTVARRGYDVRERDIMVMLPPNHTHHRVVVDGPLPEGETLSAGRTTSRADGTLEISAPTDAITDFLCLMGYRMGTLNAH